MVQYDFNNVYVGETKQNVFVKNKYFWYGELKDGQDQKDKYLPAKRSRHKKLPSTLWSSNIYFLEVMTYAIFF